MRTRTYAEKDARIILDCCEAHGLCAEAGEVVDGGVALTTRFRNVRMVLGNKMPKMRNKAVRATKGKQDAKVVAVPRDNGGGESPDTDTPSGLGDR